MALGGTPPAGEHDEVLTVQEVADYLKVTSKTVYGLVREGELPSFRVGRALRCRRCDVETFIVARLQEAGNGAGAGHDREGSLNGGGLNGGGR